jgi:ribosomal protein S18 acetylase RimI-like enzyme
MFSENKKQKVLNILFDTFYDNPASVHVVKQDHKKVQRFKLLLEYSYFLSENFGQVYLSDNEKCCALIIDSGNKKVTLKFLYWQFKLAFKVIGVCKAKAILYRLKVLNSKRPKEAHIYIWYIGVLTKSQNIGEGSKMMIRIIEDNPNRKICLESTNKKNYSFYEKHGFEKQESVSLPPFNFGIFRHNS